MSDKVLNIGNKSIGVYVINMAERHDRRDHIEKEFGNIGVEYNLVNAVNKHYFPIYGYRTSLHAATIAQTYSHISAIRRGLESDNELDFILVCEDDIKLSKDFKKRLQYLVDNSKKFENIALLSFIYDNGVELEPQEVSGINKIRNVVGSSGYLIKRSFAEQYCDRLELAAESGINIDKFNESFSNEVDFYTLLPLCIGAVMSRSDVVMKQADIHEINKMFSEYAVTLPYKKIVGYTCCIYAAPGRLSIAIDTAISVRLSNSDLRIHLIACKRDSDLLSNVSKSIFDRIIEIKEDANMDLRAIVKKCNSYNYDKKVLLIRERCLNIGDMDLIELIDREVGDADRIDIYHDNISIHKFVKKGDDVDVQEEERIIEGVRQATTVNLNLNKDMLLLFDSDGNRKKFLLSNNIYSKTKSDLYREAGVNLSTLYSTR